MNINNEVILILKAFNIEMNDGLSYLLSLYHNCVPSYVPLDLINTLDNSGIYIRRNKKVQWDIELFEIHDLSWIDEYIDLFYNINPERGRFKNECKSRMQEYLKENPHLNKEDIMSASKFYLESTDARYIRAPHYFIFKGRGVGKISELTEWLWKDAKRKENLQLFEIQ